MNREYQESTFQMPCGPHSLCEDVAAGEAHLGHLSIFTIINIHSNWASGRSHALSYSKLAYLIGIPRSTAVKWVGELVSMGWLEKNVRGGNKPNTYRVIHHKCPEIDVPLDKDNLPKKCAVPMGAGSPVEKIRDIGYKAFAAWVLKKIESNWVSGVVAFTIRQAQKMLHIATQAVCNIRKIWEKHGLAEKVCEGVLQLYPKPSEKRRNRRRENPKGMRTDGEHYYAFNERWRVSKITGDIQAKEEGPGDRWRFSNAYELERVNSKILVDFKPIIELAASEKYQVLRHQTLADTT